MTAIFSITLICIKNSNDIKIITVDILGFIMCVILLDIYIVCPGSKNLTCLKSLGP